MATYDSADLLARVKRHSKLPATDTSMADADWYALLTEAQSSLYNTWAAHIPWILVGAPVLLTSVDSGVTYPFASGIAPLYVEIYESQASPRPLRPGAYFDTSAGYVWEGIRIRFPGNVARSFANGPYARLVTPPDVIDGSTAPTLVPAHCRLALVYHALTLWSSVGGLRTDITDRFQGEETRFLWGDPLRGIVGAIPALKANNPWAGAAAFSAQSGILDGLDTGSGYSRYTIS